MGSLKDLLSLTILIGLIGYSYQQSDPKFLTILGGDNVDGNLAQRLTSEGIFENTPVGTTIGVLSCQDPDVGDTITYSVDSNTLAVTPNGIVTLERFLDRENYFAAIKDNPDANLIKYLKPIFTCTDQTGLTDVAEVDIALEDVNDNAPVFTNRPYSTNIDENTPNNTVVLGNILIDDIDSEKNSRISVTCEEGGSENENVCGTFSLQIYRRTQGAYTATITLMSSLDYETRRGYTMTIVAKDSGQPQLSASVNVVLHVKDAQDTPPEFLDVPITIYIQENVPIGTTVPLKIRARDGDQGSSRQIKIRMVNDPLGWFELGETVQSATDAGVWEAPVITVGNIDREQLNGTYDFQVQAVELDENGTFTTDVTSSSVRVDVLDVNDNVPTFTQTVYNVSLFELDRNTQSGYQIPDLDIRIQDLDITSNANYRVVIADLSQPAYRVFPTDNVTGNIAVSLLVSRPEFLDYDNPSLRNQYAILEAREILTASPRTSTATVYIQLKDLNDNSPIFTQTVYNFSLPEDTVSGTLIGTIEARDGDEGLNSQITYSISGTGSEQFRINSSTGVLTLAGALDYETNKVYQILLVARDSGSPPRETSKTLTIDVTNINDEGPEPVRTFYQTYAQETSLELRPAVIVQARDNEDPDSVITYRIIAGNTPDGAFQINPRTGELTLTRNLDFDVTPNRQGFFEIIIQASDNGSPPQFANMTVKVDVQDENNNTPVFGRPLYIATVGELAPAGTSVAIVSASDLDRGDNGKIRYTIQSGGREHFDIVENSGFISVSSKANFDYITFPEYNMIVYAIDYGSPPKTGTTTVNVQIEDANNKPPEFKPSIFVLSVSEGTPIGSSVLSVTATDPDSTADLRYSILETTVQARNSGGTVIQLESEYRKSFIVDPIRGLITTNRTLSRDIAADMSFSVLVEDINAENQRQTATASVLITILGTNISTIYFTPDRYYFSVTEGKSRGYVITTVTARDPACGNCLVNNYFEVPDTDTLGYLEVDRVSGVVSLSQPLDYENVQARRLYMEIEARASDNRRAITTVVVEVRDDNDNSPIFRQDDYVFSVSEAALYLYRVGYVKATDKDSGSFGNIQYSLSGKGAADFEIYQTGLIIVSSTANLDFETVPEYSLLVTASDNPTNATSTVRRQTSVPLRINLLDVNDNRPQFGPIYRLFIVENYEIGQQVDQIIATDKDKGLNGEVTFSMEDPSNLFRITNTGYILVNGDLRDMSPLSPFIVTVTAKDQGTPALFNETKVEIIVRSGQLDDGRPQWSIPRLGVVYYVTENIPTEQFVVTARATARSVGPEVFYSFNTDSDDHKMFKVDRLSGNVTTSGTFDREKQAVYDLILIATDRNNVTLQSYRGLTVRVLDQDDNIPDFGKCPGVSLEVPQRVAISEDTPLFSFVYRVKACDLDELANAVAYREETDNPLCAREMEGGYFRVSSDGNITTNRTLDRETKPYHLVCVRAYTPTRKKRQADGFDRAEMTDTGRIAYVVIQLNDVNDNRPIFPEKNLFEAVASVPDERTVVQVKAIDQDLSPYNRVRYSIESIIYNEPNYRAYPLPGSFSIGPDTGIVSINFPSYSDFRIPESLFNITIQAEDFLDPTLKDKMNLYVYIFEPSQTIRVVINKSPDAARDDANRLIDDLAKADPNSVYKIQQISYHRVVDNFDVTKTDVCFIVINNNKVLSVREGNSVLTQTKVDDVLRQYGASSPGSCYKTRSSLERIDWSALWWVLVALAIFIFICCVILIIAICVLFRNYKNYMNTRKTYLVPQE